MPTTATTVDSTTLATIAYDAPARTLWLEFRNRAVYCYFDVPPAFYRDLLAAPSKGAYFNRNIRGCFRYHRQTIAGFQPPDSSAL